MVKSLSVFFPAYNEEKNLQQTVEKAVNTLKNLNIPWEILIINDGSTDKTLEVAEGLAKEQENIKVIDQVNGGYGLALRAGFANAKYEWVCYTDSDGQFDFSQVNKFIECTDDAEAIWGYRIKRQDNLLRKIFAKGWILSLFIFFGLNLKDVDCGFKMIRADVLQKIGSLESSRGGMINAELAIKIRNAGFNIAQVGVNHYPRLAGEPSGASLSVIIQSYLDLFKLRIKLH